MIEQAIASQSKLEMTYLKSNDTKSTRVVLPLTIGEEEYLGKKFPGMLAFCSKRQEERMFSVARILDLQQV